MSAPIPREPFNPLRFDEIIYPLWRREMPAWIKPVARTVLSQFYPVNEDTHPPHTPQDMANYMTHWGIVRHLPAQELAECIATSTAQVDVCQTHTPAPAHDGSPVRVPAQWEPIERVLISWGILYPSLWAMHAQMAEGVSAVAVCEILVPDAMWAHGIWALLTLRGYAKMQNVRFLVLPTNDVWIRDYGAIFSKDKHGKRVAVNAIYAVLPEYPQGDDNGMTERYAAHYGTPVQPLDLHTEGGNLWSDGAGTFIMSNQLFYSNRYYTRERMMGYLHSVFDFEKALITPRLTLEETGHVDLLVKLASADTVLVASPEITTAEALRKTRRLFERETNARGQRYNVIDLPTPPLYLNWVFYTIRRHYTNSLTVNGRVLVPTFGIPQDDVALRVYEQAMPDYEIIPVDSRIGANGGGAVHCMTKEIFV